MPRTKMIDPMPGEVVPAGSVDIEFRIGHCDATKKALIYVYSLDNSVPPVATQVPGSPFPGTVVCKVNGGTGYVSCTTGNLGTGNYTVYLSIDSGKPVFGGSFSIE